jgi:hypothetical protein
MMVRLATIVAAAAAFPVLSSGAAAPPGSDPSRVLWQGPVLAGSAVAWVEQSGGTSSLHLWRPGAGDQVVYSGDALALGRPLAASPTHVAFERTYPGCPPQPGQACPQEADAVVGRWTGPYRRLVGPHTCFLPTEGTSLALDGGIAAYLEVDCDRQLLRVLVRDVARHGGPMVLRTASFSSGCCRDVALAGRYTAWIDGSRILVDDRVAHRTAYDAHIGPAGISVDMGFGLQADGKLGIAYRLVEFANAGPLKVAWLSRSAPSPHVLKLRARDTRIRIAQDRLAFERYISPVAGALVVADLSGQARTIARFAAPTGLRGSFDFDGQRIVWASDHVASTRTDCPPPGQGRPCILRESGVTTIWLEDLTSGEPRLVARLPFIDTPVHPRP